MESTGHPMTIQISEACRRSILAAAGACATHSIAAGGVLRRPAPTVVPLSSIHKSDCFLATSPKNSRLFNEAFSGISHDSGPPSPTPSRKSWSSNGRRRSSNNSSRHSSNSNLSESSLWRPSHELSRSGQQQAVATFAAGLVSPDKLRRNSTFVTAPLAEITLDAIEEESGESGSNVPPSEPAANSELSNSAESSDSASSGHFDLQARPGNSAKWQDLNDSAGTQPGSEDSEVRPLGSGHSRHMLAVPEEHHPGLPWSILNLGDRFVKGKGSMNTHLLKVGNWQQAVLAVEAEQKADARQNAAVFSSDNLQT
eukprot:GHUV01037637.1.p1 GENE.GHUV01037637.1~~GHUV01037637.1.p1  ORF type:complete len:312 (+),score=75.22 GHUV01037637.1:464-1399(+)